MTPFGFPLGQIAPDEAELPPYLPDHADAFASVLERYARLIRSGENIEDRARELLPIVRVAARLT